jgi:hypothetical protein
LSSQLEETKAQLEATERAYKASHTELAEVHERINEMTTANAALQAAKRKLDNDLQSIHVSYAIFSEGRIIVSAMVVMLSSLSACGQIRRKLRILIFFTDLPGACMKHAGGTGIMCKKTVLAALHVKKSSCPIN